MEIQPKFFRLRVSLIVLWKGGGGRGAQWCDVKASVRQRDYSAVQKHPHDTPGMQDGGTTGGWLREPLWRELDDDDDDDDDDN